MKVTFYGVRGSAPSLKKENIEIGGNTSCVVVEVEDTLLIFDGGTGIINLGQDLGQLNNMKGHILFSHYHWDHVQGLSCFKPFYNATNNFTLYGKRVGNDSIETIIKGIMVPPYFPIPLENFGCTFDFYDINPTDKMTIDSIMIDTIPIVHPGGCVGYSVSYNNTKFCYLTDMDVIDNNQEVIMAFINKADLVVMDAYFSQEDYIKGIGHSSWKDVIRIAKNSRVKQVALYHHHLFKTDDQLIDIEKEVKEEMKEAFIAREGMVISLKSRKNTI